MSTLPLAAWMFPAALTMIFVGMPVSLSLIVVAIGFSIPFFGAELAGLQLYRFIGSVAANNALAAVPLFIFMGAVLENSGIGGRVFNAMKLWLGRLPGGLALATMAMCAIFAAGTGIVGAVEVMVGLLAIPAMVANKYDKGLISGTICAGGSLGTMIPPSIVVIIYASVAQMPVGDMLAGTLIPALIMVTLFFGYILVYCILKPSAAPKVDPAEFDIPLSTKLWITVKAIIPPAILVTSVVGSILMGIAAVSEAAAVGAAGAVLLTIFYGDFSWKGTWQAAVKTIVITSMIMLIVVGGTMFTSVFRLQGGGQLVNDMVRALDLGPTGLLLLFLGIVFVMGALLDWVSVVLICIPLFMPFLAPAGIDPLWFGILVIIMIQTSYLTPPMAPSIFYLRGIAPKDFTTVEMYKGVVPFVICQVITGIVVYFWPATALWLPAFFLQ
ncbi:MAG: TRAP transporter large permease subunit [Alphaproteobacteria bacterium]|nr:TRAP transporter large permease subunit [Alphaproteobacteria bacterium]MBU0797739.1 TRAP transporter large permease subunit [Alphaproteobacteria bacterium]MBU0887100.1 TRAP transporter large permease subunit [Alphaproteobacteria bacterium]MBU1814350.1 TRAP transporter large permease subunit [Alphaproteobacteria bacterium]